MEKYINIINELFCNIKILHKITQKVNTRNKKITLDDTIAYAFIASYKNNSKGKAMCLVKKYLNNRLTN